MSISTDIVAAFHCFFRDNMKAPNVLIVNRTQWRELECENRYMAIITIKGALCRKTFHEMNIFVCDDSVGFCVAYEDATMSAIRRQP